METIAIYLLKILICSGILFGYYRWALYNERFHQWNRFYLLGAMVLSIVVPFVNIPLFTQQPQVVTIVEAMPWNIIVAMAPAEERITWQDMLCYAALLASVVLLLRILYSVVRLLLAYRQNPVSNLNSSVRLIITAFHNAPFSFFNWLFWRKDIDPASANGQRMLAHELTHIKEGHSYDKLFTELLLCVFWMNPFFWLMRRELSMIHEFLADRKAIDRNDGAAFAGMILQAMNVQPSNPLTNPFFSSQIKRRLLMITTSKQPQYSYLRRISGLGLMIGSAIILTLTVQEVQAQKKAVKYKNAEVKEIKLDYITGKIDIKLANDSIVKTTIDEAKAEKSLPESYLKLPKKSTAAEPNFNKDSMAIVVKEELAKMKKVSDLSIQAREGVLVAVSEDGEKMIWGADSGRADIVGDYVFRRDSSFFNATTTTFSKIYTGKSPIAPLYIYDGKEVSPKQLQDLAKIKQQYRIESWLGERAVGRFGSKAINGAIVIVPETSPVFLNPDKSAEVNELKIVFGEPKTAGTK